MPFKDKSKQKEYAQMHYLKNKTIYIASNKKRRQELKHYIRSLKQNTPCADCNISYPHYVMDFDHLYDKEALIKKFINNNNKSGLLNEIKKCEIVCANCHRQRTQNRLLLT